MSLPKSGNQTTVVITGASSGIGAELARGTARRGFPLLLVARRRERLDEIADEVGSEHSVAVEVMPLDLSDIKGRAKLADRLRAEPIAGCATVPASAPAGSFTSCRSNARVKRSRSMRWC